MLTNSKDTLAYQMSRPFVRKLDNSGVICSEVASALNTYWNTSGDPKSHPETDALWFYAMNHAMAELRARYKPHEPMGDDTWIADCYNAEVAPRTLRAFYYMLIICVREARHILNDGEGFWGTVQKKFGTDATEFFRSNKGGGESQAYQKFLSHSPNCTIGQLCDANAHIFHKGNWSGGYGGPAWGNVADCLARFVRGEYSAEMMMDTVWTLCHNNGPIFNKGMLYNNHHTGALMRILDAQRSGQIPQLILSDDPSVAKYVSADLRQIMGKCSERFETFNDYVDWYLVETLSPGHSYSIEKNNQAAKHGVPTKYAEALAKQKAKQKAKNAEAYNTWFTVMPGMKLKKVKMVRN